MSECQRARGVCRLTALLVASGLGVGCSLQPPQTPPAGTSGGRPGAAPPAQQPRVPERAARSLSRPAPRRCRSFQTTRPSPASRTPPKRSSPPTCASRATRPSRTCTRRRRRSTPTAVRALVGAPTGQRPDAAAACADAVHRRRSAPASSGGRSTATSATVSGSLPRRGRRRSTSRAPSGYAERDASVAAVPLSRRAGAGEQRARHVVPVEPYAMASRLSFFLWESVPDDALLRRRCTRRAADRRAARRAGAAHARATIARAASSGASIGSGSGSIASSDDEHLVRTPEVDPQLDGGEPGLGRARRRGSSSRTCSWTGVPFATCSLSRRAWVDGEMARIYGVAAPADPTRLVRGVAARATERAGLLTRASFLAGIRTAAGRRRRCAATPSSCASSASFRSRRRPASISRSRSAIRRRGRRRTACSSRRGPARRRARPATPAERLRLRASRTTTPAGAYQNDDNGLPVDASGTDHGTDVDGPFDGRIELSEALARERRGSPLRDEQWVRYALGRARGRRRGAAGRSARQRPSWRAAATCARCSWTSSTAPTLPHAPHRGELT